MSATISQSKIQVNPNLILALSSVFVTSFLFYIDEGLYSFSWMSEPGAWIVFLMYSLPIFALEILVYHLILKTYSGVNRLFLSITLGTLVALAIVVSILS